MFIRSNINRPHCQFESVDSRDLECLDKTSLTSVTEFIRAFQADKSFCPPESVMSYDTEFAPVDIDNDVAPEFGYDIDEFTEDVDKLNNARANTK